MQTVPACDRSLQARALPEPEGKTSQSQDSWRDDHRRVALNDAMILPYGANLGRMEFSERTGIEGNVIERFAGAGVPKEKISFVRDTYTFNFPSPPSELVEAFRKYYGPTMNAFEAAEKNGRASDLQKELEALFNRQNKSPSKNATSIPATFLRVTVALN